MTFLDDVKSMTEKSIKKTLFIALQYPIAPEDEMLKHIADHLRYMGNMEGKVFLSGPLVKEGAVVDEGLTVLKTYDEAEARAIMDAEPLIKAGLRRYELKLWRIQEGSITIGMSGINGTVVLD